MPPVAGRCGRGWARLRKALTVPPEAPDPTPEELLAAVGALRVVADAVTVIQEAEERWLSCPAHR
jgi:hypothetical protein